jgi:chitinase
VLGYHPGYQFDQYPIAEIDWSALTHIIFGSIGVNADYSLDLAFYRGSQAAGKTSATDLADAAHANGRTAVLMLGGAGVSNIKQAIAADVSAFADSLIAVMTSLHYDGLDLDIEDGTPLASVVSLAKTLRQKKADIILTYPGGAIEYGTSVDPQSIELAKYVDRYAIQSYYGGSDGLFTGTDYTGTTYFKSWFGSALSGASALTPFAIDYALSALATAGIPKEKLAMGMAAYAYCYDVPATTPPGGSDVSGPLMDAYAPSSYCWDCGIGGGDNQFPLSAFFSATGRLSATSAVEQKRDAVAKEPCLGLSTAVNESHCGGSTRYIVYEDETSILDKGTFSKQKGYGGIVVWTLAQAYLPANATGGRARNALTQALKHGFLDP